MGALKEQCWGVAGRGGGVLGEEGGEGWGGKGLGGGGEGLRGRTRRNKKNWSRPALKRGGGYCTMLMINVPLGYTPLVWGTGSSVQRAITSALATAW